MKIKTMKTLFVIGMLAIAFSSCKKDGWPCKNGNGAVQTEFRSLSGFTQIDNEMDAEIYVSQGAEYEIKVVAQQNLQEEIMTVLKGDELQIYSKHCINKHEPIQIYITLPVITKIDISGSGFATTTGNISSNALSLVVSGSGYFQVQDSIFTDNIDLTVSGSGKIDYVGESRTANAVISGSGNITMSGRGYASDTGLQSMLDLTVSGSGSIMAFNYPVEVCHFTISGSGLGQVNVSTLLQGTISGSGNLQYMGNPQLDVTVGGSGSVVHVL